MSGVFRYLGRVLGFSKAPTPSGRIFDKVFQNAIPTDLTRFAEGDRVLLDRTKLTYPLKRNAKFDVPKGQLHFNDIIGQPVISTFVRASKGTLHKVELPSLEEYVGLTPRLVTPVYSSYASTIVSLLDIHPQNYDQTNVSSPPTEVLEAGTGHGSLTLHLARAVAAANPPPLIGALPSLRTPNRPFLQEKQDSNPDALTQAWMQWKTTRRAVIHTVEAVPQYSIHAEKIVRSFRRGLYWPHVDFYTSDVKDWLARRPHNDQGESEYLDSVLLDMPGVHEQLRHVAPAMRDGAKMIVFVPSITQIGDCVRAIVEGDLPLELAKVLELGEGISNGRKWDVRFVTPRKGSIPVVEEDKVQPLSTQMVEEIGISEKENPSESETTTLEHSPEDEIEQIPSPTSRDQPPVMVCRPMVGERTFGGGFIALFRKVSPASAALSAEWRRSRTGRAKKRHR